MKPSVVGVSRRNVLKSAGAAAAVPAGAWAADAPAPAKPLPAYAGWKEAEALIVHSANTIETRRDAMGSSLVTPTQRLYVRNNLAVPDERIVRDRDAWQVAIEGVSQARSLTLAQMKAIDISTVATVLQCSGNGRGYFPSKPSGTAWKVGAAGCVIWSGVPVASLVEALGGIARGMRFMTGTGGEKLPPGVDPLSVVVERSLPLETMKDALLAWEMNGIPLPLAHGGPLRLIVPGYQGINNIKYINRLAFTAEESRAAIMSHGYRMTPTGAKPDPSQPSVLRMNVKSWITSPVPDAEGGNATAGMTQIVGVAFSGGETIRRVEVSIDGGRSWRDAKLVGPDLGKFAWRQFAFKAHLPRGHYVLASRASDSAGQVQPERRVDNLHGYNNNSWADHAVTVTMT